MACGNRAILPVRVIRTARTEVSAAAAAAVEQASVPAPAPAAAPVPDERFRCERFRDADEAPLLSADVDDEFKDEEEFSFITPDSASNRSKLITTHATRATHAKKMCVETGN